jgi:ketosteroid isomerase-like protein
MRKLCALGLALGLAACGGEDANTPPPQPPVPPPAAVTPPPPDPTPAPVATAAPPPAPSLTDKELATLDAYGKALANHDADALGALFTPDAVFKFAPMPDMTRDQFVAKQKEHFASFPDSKGGARRIFLKNDVAIIEWTMTGTNTGPGPMGAKSTGKPVGLNGITLVWFTPDGTLKEQHEYMDVPTMIGQLGMGPKNMKARAPASLPDGKPEFHLSKGTPDEDKNVAGAQAIQKMFETHDAKAFAETSADDVSWDAVDGPAPMNGKKEMVKYFDMVTKAIPDMKMSCTTWGVDDYVIEECATTGTNKGPFVAPGMKMAATNKPLNLHGVDVIQLKDGKAIHGWSYANGMEMAMQLGLMKPPHDKKIDAKPAAGAAPAAGTTTAKPATK